MKCHIKKLLKVNFRNNLRNFVYQEENHLIENLKVIKKRLDFLMRKKNWKVKLRKDCLIKAQKNQMK